MTHNSCRQIKVLNFNAVKQKCIILFFKYLGKNLKCRAGDMKASYQGQESQGRKRSTCMEKSCCHQLRSQRLMMRVGIALIQNGEKRQMEVQGFR